MEVRESGRGGVDRGRKLSREWRGGLKVKNMIERVKIMKKNLLKSW